MFRMTNRHRPPEDGGSDFALSYVLLFVMWEF